jgi:hypothetical protein
MFQKLRAPVYEIHPFTLNGKHYIFQQTANRITTCNICLAFRDFLDRIFGFAIYLGHDFPQLSVAMKRVQLTDVE